MKTTITFLLLLIIVSCSKPTELEPEFRRAPFRLQSTITMDMKTGGSCNDGFSYCSHTMNGSAVIGETGEGRIVLSWPSDSIGTTFYFHRDVGLGGYEIPAGKYPLRRTPYGYNYLVLYCDGAECEFPDEYCECGTWTLADNIDPL